MISRIASWMLFALSSSLCFAGTDGSISGFVHDSAGNPLSGTVELQTLEGKKINEVSISSDGTYQFPSVQFGDYQIKAKSSLLESSAEVIHVTSGGNSTADLQVQNSQEMVVQVKAKRRMVQNSASTSSVEMNQESIKVLPQGDQVRLPRLIANTTPGVVQGAFGQMFIRGNHANIQYQIDGIQMPESPSNTFGEALSPRNIDHMEVITGGIPAEYGERLGAVVNVVTKSGPETPGGNIELNYGAFNRTSPALSYGGSNESGNFHYFFSANYSRTDRGLDSPQPASLNDLTQGGKELVHNSANANNQFVKLDWLLNNNDKLTVTLFNAYNFYQIPNYPSNYAETDWIFHNGTIYNDEHFIYTPSYTDNTQTEMNDYIQAIWKHTISPTSFLQVASYYKYSYMNYQNDPVNDLIMVDNADHASEIVSFKQNRHVNTVGAKLDYSARPDDRNLFKAGLQVQAAQSSGFVTVLQKDASNLANTIESTNADPNMGYSENVYVQDDFTIAKPLVLNAGIRFSATQFNFSGLTPSDYMFQPRVGLNYMASETTKLHIFYGKLFQPSPLENLRMTYSNLNPGAGLAPYDVKAEKDDYYEAGIAQQFLGTQVAALNVYYKNATNLLDDAQLLNTAIAQPYNYAQGYSAGLEFSVRGKLNEDWSEFANYSYGISQGKGVSGGIFALKAGEMPGPGYQFLDHVQLHTVSSGLTYAKNNFWGTVQGLYGSGLRTGPANSRNLPGHFTMDFTVGYQFKGKDFWSNWRTSLDVLNAFDNVYPITIANGFNGSHYAAGREFFIRVSKDL